MKAIIMAAGKGTRLASLGEPMPKVLREAAGRPLLSHALDSISFVDKDDIVIVAGYMHEKVEKTFSTYNIEIQGDDAYGTGYAVMCGVKSSIFDNYSGDIIILNGDMPLLRQETVEKMYQIHSSNNNDCTFLTCVLDDPTSYGRIIRNNGKVVSITEDADCSDEEKKVKEVNIGTYIFKMDVLRDALSRIDCNNAKHEYYLTDVPKIIIGDGKKVDGFVMDDEKEAYGVNTPEDLMLVDKILVDRAKKQ